MCAENYQISEKYYLDQLEKYFPRKGDCLFSLGWTLWQISNF